MGLACPEPWGAQAQESKGQGPNYRRRARGYRPRGFGTFKVYWTKGRKAQPKAQQSCREASTHGSKALRAKGLRANMSLAQPKQEHSQGHSPAHDPNHKSGRASNKEPKQRPGFIGPGLEFRSSLWA